MPRPRSAKRKIRDRLRRGHPHPTSRAGSTEFVSWRWPSRAGSTTHHNLLIVGATGVGKTCIACALAQAAPSAMDAPPSYLCGPRMLNDPAGPCRQAAHPADGGSASPPSPTPSAIDCSTTLIASSSAATPCDCLSLAGRRPGQPAFKPGLRPEVPRPCRKPRR